MGLRRHVHVLMASTTNRSGGRQNSNVVEPGRLGSDARPAADLPLCRSEPGAGFAAVAGTSGTAGPQTQSVLVGVVDLAASGVPVGGVALSATGVSPAGARFPQRGAQRY